jgi:hypothetical protein
MLIATAFSSHHTCFICRKKTNQLRLVKKQDIYHAYVSHRIFIKHHSRVCIDHLEPSGLIRKSDFLQIPTTEQAHDPKSIKMFDILAVKCTSVFAQFEKPKYLEDEHCKKITGWSKDEFLQFSSFISSKTLRNSKTRSKEQLIALYRYWLRTGIDQNSLAALFGNNAKQYDISSYLSQIRVAINKDFVPLFLGAYRPRNFFLQHNTVMTSNLNCLSNDNLVVIADGTYCRIEKSANNDVQYKTWSVQKQCPLFKPFLLCCADGYIIDCYGPFPANNNDATILNYVLENDRELQNILIKNKTTLILDRGNYN